MEKPLVTIYCLTYNHANFIRDALDSFLMQKTSFKVKVFVYDDSSTDGTDKILLNYAERYPDFFDIYISPVNTFNSPKRWEIIQNLYKEHLEGKYVAVCEGDDYWTDPEKLQTQVDFLEEHSDVAMVAHASEWVNCQNMTKKEYRPYKCDMYLTPEDVIVQYNGNLSTASLVMTKDAFILENEFPKCDVGDIPLQLSALLKGKVYYYNRVMSVYRYMHEGSWSKSYSDQLFNRLFHNDIMVKFYVTYDKYTNYRFHDHLIQIVLNYLYANVFSSVEKENANEICLLLSDIVSQEKKFADVVEEQKRMIKIISSEKFEEGAKISCCESKHILIYGQGEYAKYLSRYFEKNNIEIDGYLISNDQKCKDKFDRRPVWHINEFPYRFDDTVICIGVNQRFENQIKEALKPYNIKKIYTPLWFDLERLWKCFNVIEKIGENDY